MYLHIIEGDALHAAKVRAEWLAKIDEAQKKEREDREFLRRLFKPRIRVKAISVRA